MAGPKTIKGLKNNARSPGSISNSEHHDWSGSNKAISGTGVKIKEIITPTAAAPIEDFALLRVVNTTGALAFIWIGEEGDDPVTLDATNSMALPAGHWENFYSPVSEDCKKSVMVKTSAAGVQVVVMEA